MSEMTKVMAYRQGDLYFFPREKAESTYMVEATIVYGEKLVLATGRTGNQHVAISDGDICVDVIPSEKERMAEELAKTKEAIYIPTLCGCVSSKDEIRVLHVVKVGDEVPHRALVLPPGCYEVRRQRDFNGTVAD